MNETIKEGDYVEYVGRPNEKFLVKKSSDREFMYILTEDKCGAVYFYEDGKLQESDTHPIVKKTTPPKKKVLKEFDVDASLDMQSYNKSILIDENIFYLLHETYNDKIFKAKLIIEVEE